jgi:soluble lytic murein transglycosylase
VSPSGATVQTRRDRARRPSAARRRAAARRRRWLLAVLLVAFAVVGVVVLMPLARKAANEFGLPLQYQSVIRQQAAEKRLDPALIAAVIYAETKFDPRTSSAGALGLMQILPQTAEFLAHRTGAKTFTTADLSTPQVNIAYGSYYLRFLLDQYGGSTVLALAAYNGGEANVDSWLAAARAHGKRFTSADIRFPETRAYVDRVLKAQRDYRHTYASQLGYT